MNRKGETFKYLDICDAKVKEEMFVGRQIHQQFKDDAFNSVQENEKAVWESFKHVVDNFLGGKLEVKTIM